MDRTDTRVIKRKNEKYLVQEKSWLYGWNNVIIKKSYFDKPDAYFDNLNEAIAFAKKPEIMVVGSQIENGRGLWRIIKLRDEPYYRLQEKIWLLGWFYSDGSPSTFSTSAEAMDWLALPEITVLWP